MYHPAIDVRYRYLLDCISLEKARFDNTRRLRLQSLGHLGRGVLDLRSMICYGSVPQLLSPDCVS
jgi:hypothetical protein